MIFNCYATVVETFNKRITYAYGLLIENRNI